MMNPQNNVSIKKAIVESVDLDFEIILGQNIWDGTRLLTFFLADMQVVM